MENVTLSELFLLNLQREGLIRTPTDKYQHGYLEGFYDEFLEKFREIENEKSNPSIKKFFQKAKRFWKN